MARMFRCDKCGKLFDWPKVVDEYRGECWGVPAYEPTAYSPCCNDNFEEIPVDEYGQPIEEDAE